MNNTMPYLIIPCQVLPDLPDHLRLTYALLLGLAHGTADGAILPPSAPGLGVELDRNAAIERPFKMQELPHYSRADGSLTNW